MLLLLFVFIIYHDSIIIIIKFLIIIITYYSIYYKDSVEIYFCASPTCWASMEPRDICVFHFFQTII